MTDQEAERWNARYGKFYLSRYSPAQMKHIRVGGTYTDIRLALAAAARADKRNGTWMTFIDADQPNA